MIKLNFTNTRGQSIELYGSPFRLSNFEGLGDVEADIQMQKSPFQDGSTFTDSLLLERYIKLELKIEGKDEVDLANNRRLLSGIFSPKLGPGILQYTDESGSKQIYAVAEGVPTYPDGSTNRGRTFQKALLFLVCPNPYWQDINPIVTKLQDFVGNFFFPISFPASFSIRGDEKNLLNEGHAPTPIKVTFRGEAVNPMITKVSTGEFIRINRTIPAEHSLVITTDFDYRTVRIVDPYGNEKNAMGYIDLDGTFFSLDVGENNLKFITSGGNPEVFIEYRNLYLGV